MRVPGIDGRLDRSGLADHVWCLRWQFHQCCCLAIAPAGIRGVSRQSLLKVWSCSVLARQHATAGLVAACRPLQRLQCLHQLVVAIHDAAVPERTCRDGLLQVGSMRSAVFAQVGDRVEDFLEVWPARITYFLALADPK